MKTLIIGGVAGGASCAARLRRLDESAEIIILERGEFISFANCGLPYYIGGDIPEKANLTLQTPQSFKARFNIDVRIFSEAISIDSARKIVTVKNVQTGEVYEESYDKLVLSPGAFPIVPNIEGADSEKVFTLRNIPDTMKIKGYIDREKPKSAVVVGGGYIGVEMAENLKKAGLEVTIVELSDHLITPLDFDMATEVHRYVKAQGIRLILKNGVTAIKESDRNLQIHLNNGCIEADMVIISVGVRPDTAFLKDSGVELDGKGSIVVNSKMQTNIENIYAVGDAVSVKNFITNAPAFIPLAGPANKQGRIVADNICGIPSVFEGTQGSSVLKLFDMTVATTGLNEKSAKDAGFDFDKTYTYSASHASYYPDATMMSVKVLWDKATHKILGAQIVGFDGVDKRMDVIATAIRLGAKVTEVARGKIEGFMHIPLDSLRERISEIPKDKPVYVHCHSGLRSYIACRILTGYGFDCYNLAGGYRFYESVINEKSVPEYICTECK